MSERARHARAKKISLRSENKPRGLCFSKALYGGLICGGKFALLNQLGQLIVERKFKCYCTVFAFFYFVFAAVSKYKRPGTYIGRGDSMERFECYTLEGLIQGGGYFRNFTVIFFLFSPLACLTHCVKHSSERPIKACCAEASSCFSLKNWRKIFKPCAKRSNSIRVIYFDINLKIAFMIYGKLELPGAGIPRGELAK